jgi:hypothetical protein
MYEVLAIVAGIGLGAALRRVPRGRAVVLLVPLGMLLGTAVSALAGELELSVGFVVFDTLQVTMVAVATHVVVNALAARRVT